jgi:hypothetical protein
MLTKNSEPLKTMQASIPLLKANQKAIISEKNYGDSGRQNNKKGMT